MEPPGKLIMCFLQFVGHRGLCHMPEASEGREAVVASILVCGKGQEKQVSGASGCLHTAVTLVSQAWV